MRYRVDPSQVVAGGIQNLPLPLETLLFTHAVDLGPKTSPGSQLLLEGGFAALHLLAAVIARSSLHLAHTVWQLVEGGATELIKPPSVVLSFNQVVRYSRCRGDCALRLKRVRNLLFEAAGR